MTRTMIRRMMISRLTENRASVETSDAIAVERPLLLWINEQVQIHFSRSPGQDEALAIGWLICQGALKNPSDVHGFNLLEDEAHDTLYLTVDAAVLRATPNQRDASGQKRSSMIYDGVRQDTRRISPDTICELRDTLEEHQHLFHETGASHAVALFAESGKLLAIAEDISRTQAAFKAIGLAFLSGQLTQCCYAITSSRAGFELVDHLCKTPVCLIAAVGAPTSRSVDLCRALNVTLAGFLRKHSMNIYSGTQRVILP